MDLDDVKNHFRDFANERLTKSAENKKLIDTFTAPYEAEGLERYIRDNAWEDDEKGRTRVYFIKDADDQVVLYYSLRCGLVIDDSAYEKLDADQRQCVDWMTKSIKNNDSDQMSESYEYCAVNYSYDKADHLYEIAAHRAEIKNDKEELENVENTLHVEESYSAIELQHFCKNANYHKKDFHGIPIGFGLFWEQIVPQIERIVELIGCEYLYLFAADKAQGSEPKKLVEHYKSAMKFSSVEGVKIVKPYYDVNCISLVQPLIELEKNRQKAWEEYSDLIL